MPSELSERYKHSRDNAVNIRAAVAELVGICLFVFCGLCTAAFVSYYNTDAPPMLNNAIVGCGFGGPIVIMVYATAHISGGQLNPAITCGCMAVGATSIAQGILNICAQILGTIMSAAFLKAIAPDEILKVSDYGSNFLPPDASQGQAFFAEIIATFTIMLVVLETAVNKKTTASCCAPIAIGLAFALLITAINPISTGSLNPARSLGPAIVSGEFKNLWIWIFGPIFGALLAAPLHLYFSLHTTHDASMYGADQVEIAGFRIAGLPKALTRKRRPPAPKAAHQAEQVQVDPSSPKHATRANSLTAPRARSLDAANALDGPSAFPPIAMTEP